MCKAVTGIAPCSPEGFAAAEAFGARYEAEFGVSVGVYCDTLYDAVRLVALAVEKAGVYDRAKITDALWQVGQNYAGVSSTITFDEKSERAWGTYEMWKVEKVDGEYEFTRIRDISL